MITSFNNLPRFVASPNYDDDSEWFVIDNHKCQMVGYVWSKEDAQAEVSRLNKANLN